MPTSNFSQLQGAALVRAVLDASTEVAIIATDPAGLITVFNTGAERMLGYSAAEMVGRQTPAVFHLEPEVFEHGRALSEELGRPVAGFEAFVARARAGTQETREWTYVRKDGAHLTVALSVTALRNPQGEVTGFLGVASDVTEKRRTLGALAESESRYRDIFENASDLIQSIGPDGCIQYVNQAWTSALGYSASEARGKSIWDIVHPESRAHCELSMRELFEGKPVGLVQAQFVARDGHVLDVEGHVSCRFEHGRPVATRGIFRDVSERESRQRALAVEHAAAVVMAEAPSAREAIPRFLKATCYLLGCRAGAWWTPDPQHATLRCKEFHSNAGPELRDFEEATRNLTLSRGVGLPGRVLTTLSPVWIRDLSADDNFPRAPHARTAGIATGFAFPVHHGERLWGVMEFYSNVIEQRGQALMMMCESLGRQFGQFLQHKADEEALAGANALMAAIVNNAVDGILTIDSTGTVETCNAAAERIFGRAASEVVGRNVKLLMPEPYHSEHDGYLERYLRTGDPRVIGIGREVSGRRGDGTEFPMELSVSEVAIAGRRVFAGLVRDITERKHVERMKNEFISTVSHELRTPLTSIRGSLGLLAGGLGGQLSEKARSLLDIGVQNCERLVRLVSDMLDIEKIASGKMSFEMRPHELRPLLEQAAAASAGYADQHGVLVRVEAPDEPLAVSVDLDRFLQVVANLISNACKYSPRGGEVTLTAARTGAVMRVAVTDRGPGIPEAFRGRIFQRFAQADSSDARQKGGTGLGLNISKAIVERMGGQLDFETEPGVGTTFFFSLPCLPQAAVPVAALPAVSPASAARVLVCEDDPSIATVLAAMLAEQGYEVALAPTAAEALRLLEERPFDAMTLDLRLPDKDGFAFLKELRASERHRELKVIVVSAEADEYRKVVKGDAVLVSDWLGKPIDPARLVASIRRETDKGIARRARILHVEDDEGIAGVVGELLEETADVMPAGTLAEARALLAVEPFDLVLLDLGLPDGSGAELLAGLRNADGRSIPVVIFSAQEAAPAVTAQVDAALVKLRTPDRDLVEVVRSALRSRG